MYTESRWSPPGVHLIWHFLCQMRWTGVDSMDSRHSTWSPPGFQVEINNYLAGLPAKEINGLHVDYVDSMCSMWIPPGIYGGG